MRSRSTYLLVAILLILAGGIFWQRWQRGSQQRRLQRQVTSLAVADTSAIDRVTILHASTTLELHRQGLQWVIASAGNIAADQNPVTQLLQNIQQLRVLSVAATGGGDIKSLGLAERERTELTLRAGDRVVRQLRVGNSARYGTGAYVQLIGDPTVYLAEPISADLLMRTDWRDKTILRFTKDDVQEITYQRSRQRFTLTRKDSQWQLDGSPAKQEAADLFAENLGNLNALEFVAPETEFKPLNITIGITTKDKSFELVLGQAPKKDEAFLKSSDGKLYLLANTNRVRLTKERKEFVP